MTKRHFYVRAAEHMGISHLTNKCLKNVKQLAISDHLLTCNCNIKNLQYIKDFSLFIKRYNKCRKNTESENPKVLKTKIETIMLLSNLQCVIVKN